MDAKEIFGLAIDHGMPHIARDGEEPYSYEFTPRSLLAFAHAIADLQREEICSIADHLAYNEYRTPSEVHVLEELTAKIRATKGEEK